MADSANVTFKTTKIDDNEIVKAVDFEFGFESLVENLTLFSKMIFDCENNFIVGGKVIPAGGMTVKVMPIFGVNGASQDTVLPFGMTAESDPISIEQSETSNRIDIIEVKSEWVTYDEQQRAYNDLDTDTITYQDVDTKKRLKCSFVVKKGTEASAPDTDEGYVKICEIQYTQGSTEIDEDCIFNVTADIPDMDNEGWTNETDSTYNVGFVSDIGIRYRQEHNADGSHKSSVIHASNIDLGNGSNQLNGSKLNKGGANTTIGETSIPATSNISDIINIIATEFNKSKFRDIESSLQSDTWIKISAPVKTDTVNLIADSGEEVVIPYSEKSSNVFGWNSKAVRITSGNVKIDTLKTDAQNNLYVLVKAGCYKFTVQSENSLSITTSKTNPDSSCTEVKILTLERDTVVTQNSNNLATSGAVFSVKQELNSSIASSNQRIKALEDSDFNKYANKVLSRFNPVENTITLATTENITLSEIQVVDGVQTALNDLVLVKNQTNPAENGVWIVTNTAWVRSNSNFDYSTFDKIQNKLFVIKNGETNKNKVFYTPIDKSGVISGSGVSIEFVEFVKFATQLLKDNSVTSEKLASDLTLKGETKGTFKGNVTGNITGNVTGNADTATKATNDSDGNKIVDTYAKIERATNRKVITGYISGTTAYLYTYGD